MQLASGTGLWQRLTQSFGKYTVGQVCSGHAKLACSGLTITDNAHASWLTAYDPYLSCTVRDNRLSASALLCGCHLPWCHAACGVSRTYAS